MRNNNNLRLIDLFTSIPLPAHRIIDTIFTKFNCKDELSKITQETNLNY